MSTVIVNNYSVANVVKPQCIYQALYCILKGQSHKKFGEMRIWAVSQGHN
jgi:hypothetical protein